MLERWGLRKKKKKKRTELTCGIMGIGKGRMLELGILMLSSISQLPWLSLTHRHRAGLELENGVGFRLWLLFQSQSQSHSQTHTHELNKSSVSWMIFEHAPPTPLFRLHLPSFGNWLIIEFRLSTLIFPTLFLFQAHIFPLFLKSNHK